MTDIVERLRSHVVWEPEVGEVMDQAADEIERLRLTDAEREAVAWAARLAQSQRDSRDMAGDYAASMRGLLERLGAANNGEDRRSGCGE